MAMRAQKPGVPLQSFSPSCALFQCLEWSSDKIQKPKAENASFQGCFLGWCCWSPQPKELEEVFQDAPSLSTVAARPRNSYLGGSFCSLCCLVGCQHPAPSMVGGT